MTAVSYQPLSHDMPLPQVRGVRCATAVCADRGNALSTHLAAKAELDARKVRWAKLRGTPGSGPDKLAEAERDISDSEARVRDTRIVYESLVATMTEELHRWQRERAADMTALLRDFALSQVCAAAGFGAPCFCPLSACCLCCLCCLAAIKPGQAAPSLHSCETPPLFPSTAHNAPQTSMASEGVRAWSGLLAELQAVAGGGDTAVASVPPASG